MSDVLPAVRRPDDLRDLKVRIPVRQLSKLHALKVLQGQSMQAIVAAALDAYFERPDVAALASV